MSDQISPTPQEDNLVIKLANVAHSGYSYFKAQLKAGYTNKAVYLKRKSVCEGCTARDSKDRRLYRVDDKGVPHCGIPFEDHILRTPEIDGCGCDLKKKLWVAAEQCPLNFWLKEK